MADTPQPGYEHGGTFYPLVPVTEWTTEDADIAKRCTSLSVNELFFGDDGPDAMLSRSALVAVAMHHAKPEVPFAQIVNVVRHARPFVDFTPVGLSVGDEDGPKDESSPDVPSPSSSPGTSGGTTAASSET